MIGLEILDEFLKKTGTGSDFWRNGRIYKGKK